MTSFFTTFIFGLLAAFLAVIIEIVTAISPLALKLDSARHVGLYTQYWLTWAGLLPLVLLAAIEESVRFVFLRQFILRFRPSDSPSGPIEKTLLGIAFGVGFSSLEIFLILGGTERVSPWLQLAGIVMLHVVMSIILSFLLLSNHPKKRFVTAFVLALTILLHTLYNLGILLYS